MEAARLCFGGVRMVVSELAAEWVFVCGPRLYLFVGCSGTYGPSGRTRLRRPFIGDLFSHGLIPALQVDYFLSMLVNAPQTNTHSQCPHDVSKELEDKASARDHSADDIANDALRIGAKVHTIFLVPARAHFCGFTVASRLSPLLRNESSTRWDFWTITPLCSAE
jgi:hypothetical protein